jgi:hypothetical protein
MFSFPQEASLVGSIGLNFKSSTLNSAVYFATKFGLSPL